MLKQEESMLSIEKKKKMSSVPPRPRNSWIIYCAENRKFLPADIDATEKTKILAQQWANESASVKRFYSQLAKEEAIAHKELYPDYKYSPKRQKKSPQPQTKGKKSNSACSQSECLKAETVLPTPPFTPLEHSFTSGLFETSPVLQSKLILDFSLSMYLVAPSTPVETEKFFPSLEYIDTGNYPSQDSIGFPPTLEQVDAMFDKTLEDWKIFLNSHSEN